METGFLDDVTGKLGITRASRPMLIGMAVILVLAAAAVAHVLSGAAAASDFEIESSSNSASSAYGQEDAEEVYVHVSGEVNNPGLYELQRGSRVADAVNAAGGFSDDADESACNLARIVEDGEHVVIPAYTDAKADGAIESATLGGGTVQGAGPVNLNTADAETLETLPGIGTVTARRIIADRDANGPFNSIDDLMRVSGIGQKKLEALEGLVCV